MLVLSAMLLSGCQSGGEPKVTEPIPPRDPAYNVGEIRIGDRSIAQYKVVLAEDASESERFAAQELVDYIALATGKTLETAESAEYAIRIGGNTDETLGEEGFEIRVEGEDLVIAGGKTRGTLYGVYTFLEDYVGWRWYDYDCEAVKVSDFIQIPSDLRDRQTPVLETRRNWWYCFDVPELDVKRKCVSVYKAKYGDDINYTGTFGHNFYEIVPPETYYAEHPEYYSEKILPGERNGQLCLTNPEVLEITKAYFRELLKKNPDAQIVCVMQEDNAKYCKCDACMAVAKEEDSQAGPLIRFVNAVAEDIASYAPGVIVETYAYQHTRKPPKITRPAENVQMLLCSIECCFAHTFDDPNCKENAKFMEDLKGWSAICDKLRVYDYGTNFQNFNTPFPNFDTLRKNMRILTESGVTGYLMEGAHYPNQWPHKEFGALKAYLCAKLMWNPYMSEEEYSAHIDDFLEGYYGPGWKNLREYIDLLQTRVKEHPERHMKFWGPPTCFVEEEDLEKIEALWEAARAGASEEQLTRIDRSYVSALYETYAFYYFYSGSEHPDYTAKARELHAEVARRNAELDAAAGAQ